MSEIRHEYTPFTKRQKIARGLALSAASLITGAGAATGVFLNNATDTHIAATEMSLTPTFDGHFTGEGSILLPDFRLPIDLPLGLGIHDDIGASTIPPSNTPGEDIGRIAQTYGAVAAQPSGEAAKVQDVLLHQAEVAGLVGLGAATVPPALYFGLGRRRRQELLESTQKHSVPLLAAAGVAGMLIHSVQYEAPPLPESITWVSAEEMIPELAQIPEAKDIEIRNTAFTSAMRQLANGLIDSYRQSKVFYSDLKDKVPTIESELMKAEEDETVALVLSDRHDNIGMDPVHRAVGDAAGATILIDAGDDTSAGQPWEEFSLSSLYEQFKDYTIVAVAGNHDYGKFVLGWWNEHDVFTPNGEIQNIEGISMYLQDDPRHSDYTGAVVDGEISYDEAKQQVAEATCAADIPVALVLVHSVSMAENALEQGCVDLGIGGHLHVAYAPEATVGQNGHIGYEVTNASSGGASFSFSFGTDLRRSAGDTLIKFREDESGNMVPVAVQQITFTTNGEIIDGEIIELVNNDAILSGESITPKVRDEIQALLENGKLSTEKIAARINQLLLTPAV